MMPSPPVNSIVLKRKMAPAMIRMGVQATNNPFTTFACTRFGSERNMMSTMKYKTRADKGSALFDGMPFFFTMSQINNPTGRKEKMVSSMPLVSGFYFIPAFPFFEVVIDILKSGLRNIVDRLFSKKGLVRCDEYIWKSLKSHKLVILDHRFTQIFEEKVFSYILDSKKFSSYS